LKARKTSKLTSNNAEPRYFFMKIPPHIARSQSRQSSDAASSLIGNTRTSAQLSQQAGLLGNPLTALEALEQWRVHEENTQRNACRWNSDAMPLRVAIKPGSNAPEPIRQQKELWAVIKQWEAASQGLIRFTLVEATPWAPSTADIIITWTGQTTLGRDFEVGHTQRTVQGKWLTHATITLIQEPVIDGHLSPAKRVQRLQATVLHEMGHALGLEHSQDKRDVMYYRGWQRTTLSIADIQRIQDLYRRDNSLRC
jgi:predicted Zn-dependent protease